MQKKFDEFLVKHIKPITVAINAAMVGITAYTIIGWKKVCSLNSLVFKPDKK